MITTTSAHLVSSFDRSKPASMQDPSPPTLPTRREHRERDFGIGYGNSSGYASNRRYASHWGAPRFRCA
ncbi:MAG: hypothetical protein M3485_01730 [Pseudomonadota bacterium]|nr:hypothetical protein [Pseudomonadota bacterium]